MNYLKPDDFEKDKNNMLKIVGTSLPLIDAEEKVTGRARYTSDLAIRGMLYGKIIHAKVPHAEIKNIEIKFAAQVPGVVAILTGKDCPQKTYGEVISDENILAIDKVRYEGEEVAIIVATNKLALEEAADLLKIEYSPLDSISNIEKALAEETILIHQTENNIAGEVSFELGNVEQAFAEADYLVEEEFVTSQTYHAYLEPHAAIAEPGLDNRLTLWTSIQNPTQSRYLYAEALGISPEGIRIIQPYIGGGFGGKQFPKLALLCSFAAMKVGRPVKIEYSRAEDFLTCQPRVSMKIKIKVGINKSGKILGKEVSILADNGAYTREAKVIIQTACLRIDNLYRIPNLKAEAKLVYTTKQPTSAFRGYGNAQMHFAFESMMDIVAQKVNIDPKELRIINGVEQGDITYRGGVLRSCALKESIQTTVKEIGYPGNFNKNGLKSRGIGIACGVHISGSRSKGFPFCASAALVKVNQDGQVVVYNGETDIGQGSRTIFAQIVSEELTVPVKEIRVAQVDTEIMPWAIGTFSSRVTYLGGGAVQAAARDARQQILTYVSCKLTIPSEHLVLENGVIKNKYQGKLISLAEAARDYAIEHGGTPILGTGFFEPDLELPTVQGYGNISGGYPFGTVGAEVEVNELTGEVVVIKLVCAFDIGRPINPLMAEGQVEGGVATGLGWALTEEIKTHEGRIVNANFLDYQIPAISDMPTIKVIFMDSLEPSGPFGAKSVAECAVLQVAPAIVNAIEKAVGVRVKELPVSAEKIKKLLEKRGKVSSERR